MMITLVPLYYALDYLINEQNEDPFLNAAETDEAA